MDLLTDVLREAGLRRRLLDLRHLPADAALRFPCERSLGFHVVTAGRVWLHAPALAEPVALEPGDVAVMARGCTHRVALHASLAGLAERPITPDGEPAPAAPGGASLISGAYQLWSDPVHPFFAELPPWTVMRAAQRPPLGPVALAVALLGDEAGHEGALGRDTILHGLLDVLFAYLLREIVAQRGADGAGWSHAVRDAAIRRVLERMHADCARPWTLEALAREAGLSRSALAERFRAAMGETPLAYLRTVRVQRAMRLLAETGLKLETIAAEVGYRDAFGFSKAFKRSAGIAPAEFRRRDAAERASPWRLGGAAA